MSREARLDEMLQCGLIDDETYRKEIATERARLVKRAGFSGLSLQGAAQGALHDNQRGADAMGRAAYGGQLLRAENVVQVRTVTVEVLPSCVALAAALFKTDPDVNAFVSEVSDWVGPRVPKHLREDEFPASWNRETDMARRDAAFVKAFERDERGWATRATNRAKTILAMLGRASQTGSADR